MLLWRLLKLVLIFPAVWVTALLVYIATPTLKAGSAAHQALTVLNRDVSLPRQSPQSDFVRRVFKTEAFLPFTSGVVVGGNSPGLEVDYNEIRRRNYFVLDFAWSLQGQSLILASPLALQELKCEPEKTSLDFTHYVNIADGYGVSLPWFNVADSVLLDVQTRPLVHEVNLAAVQLQMNCRMRKDDDEEVFHLKENWRYVMTIRASQSQFMLRFGFDDLGQIFWLEFGGRDASEVDAPSQVSGLRTLLMHVIAPPALAIDKMGVLDYVGYIPNLFALVFWLGAIVAIVYTTFRRIMTSRKRDEPTTKTTLLP